MNVQMQVPATLPDWVQDAIESGGPADGPLRRRTEPRRLWSLTCSALPRDQADGNPVSVSVNNIGSRGIGFISSTALPVGQWHSLTPTYISHDAVIHGRVVHCTPIVQGYRIGCAFAPAGVRTLSTKQQEERFVDFEPTPADRVENFMPVPMLL